MTRKKIIVREKISVRKQKKKKSRRVRPMKLMRGGGLSPGTRMYAESLMDPWSTSGCIPDAAKGVGCYSVKQQFGQATGAGGSCNFFAWNPNVGGQALSFNDTASVNSTPTVAGNWANATSIAILDAFYAKARPISAGVRATYIGNTQTDGGFLVAGVVSGGVPLSAFNGVAAGPMAGLCKSYEIIPLRNGAQVRWEPDDQIDTANFTTFTSGAQSVASTYAAPYLVLGVFSATPNQGTLAIEAIANFEGQFDSLTFMPGGLTDTKEAPAEVGWYEAAMNLSRNYPSIAPAIGQFFQEGGKAIANGALNMANGYAQAALIGNNGLPRLKWK
jgi:hypothetical protein